MLKGRRGKGEGAQERGRKLGRGGGKGRDRVSLFLVRLANVTQLYRARRCCGLGGRKRRERKTGRAYVIVWIGSTVSFPRAVRKRDISPAIVKSRAPITAIFSFLRVSLFIRAIADFEMPSRFSGQRTDIHRHLKYSRHDWQICTVYQIARKIDSIFSLNFCVQLKKKILQTNNNSVAQFISQACAAADRQSFELTMHFAHVRRGTVTCKKPSIANCTRRPGIISKSLNYAIQFGDRLFRLHRKARCDRSRVQRAASRPTLGFVNPGSGSDSFSL